MFRKPFLLLSFLLLSFLLPAVSLSGREKPLPADGWQVFSDGSAVSMLPGEGPAVSVAVSGGPESFPRLTLSLPGEDWREYSALSFEALLESPDSCVREAGKDFVAVLTDRSFLIENTAGAAPARQEIAVPHVRCGEWQRVSVDLRGYARKQVSELSLYLYDRPFHFPHAYTVRLRHLRLEGPDRGALFFDGVDYGTGFPETAGQVPTAQPDTATSSGRQGNGQGRAKASTRPAAALQTADGLRMEWDASGRLSRLLAGKRPIGEAGGAPAGLLLRDAASGRPPVPAGGRIVRTSGRVCQQADLPDLGLTAEAVYETVGNSIEISGTVASLRPEERTVTVYVALPAAPRLSWRFCRSLLHDSRPFADATEAPLTEEVVTEFPAAALADDSTDCGVALLVNPTCPVVFRLGFNPAQRLFYAAFDVALLPGERFDGSPMNRASFRLRIARIDPVWGFRSAIEKLYALFPACYADSVGFGGGWELWTRGQFGYNEAQNRAGGYRFDWDARNIDSALWASNTRNGFLNLLYAEPEYMQFSLGDLARPALSDAERRLTRLLAGDTAEWRAFLPLRYTRFYSGTIHAKAEPLRPFLDSLLTSAAASAMHDAEGRTVWNLGRRDWIGDSGFGVMIPCNLSPHLPGGRGDVMYRLGAEAFFREYLRRGWAPPAGFGWDELMMAPDNYRRDHFRYMETPLGFDRRTLRPLIPRGFGTVEWLRHVNTRSPGLRLMANCKGPLTFAAPWIDIFGIEDTYPLRPDYFRVQAGPRRPVTNVSYTPPDPHLLAYNLLWCIYTGRNAPVETLAPMVEVLDRLYAAGWEPVTGVRAEADPHSGTAAETAAPSPVRTERYGSAEADTIYLVVHNLSDLPLTASLTPDFRLTGRRRSARPVYGEGEWAFSGGRLTLALTGRQTRVMTLTRR